MNIPYDVNTTYPLTLYEFVIPQMFHYHNQHQLLVGNVHL
eukprot:UN05210